MYNYKIYEELKMKMTYTELKAFIKANALKITKLKKTRKEVPDGYVPGLQNLQYETRHLHIAFCLIRGRTIDEIEKPAVGNEHNAQYVKRIMDNFIYPPKPVVTEEDTHAETVCDCP